MGLETDSMLNAYEHIDSLRDKLIYARSAIFNLTWTGELFVARIEAKDRLGEAFLDQVVLPKELIKEKKGAITEDMLYMIRRLNMRMKNSEPDIPEPCREP